MTVTFLVPFTHRKVMTFITHLAIMSILLACNMYAIKRTSKTVYAYQGHSNSQNNA